MSIQEFIANFSNYPILFLGSGFSLRYLQHSYSWPNLLNSATQFLTGSDREFLRSRNSHITGSNYNYEDVATDIGNLYEEVLDKTKEDKFSELNEKYYELLRKNIRVSRLKLRIAEMLSDLSRKEEMEDEFQSFIKAAENINSIITTNYDELIESTLDFTPYVGNDILLSNPYGALYKVHGSVQLPSSIIITHDDYQKFNEEYELIRAQLISIFTHNPIIFLGYRLQDKDINRLLSTIFKYVDYNSSLSETIRKNFLVVEHEPGSMNQNVQELDMIIGSQSIKVNKLKTDNFKPIYESIANLKLLVSAIDLRRLRDVVVDIYEGTSNVKVKIFENVNSLRNGDKVLAIGSKQIIRYENLHTKDYINDYFDIIEENDEFRVMAIDKIQIQSTQFFPIYGFNTIYPSLNQFQRLSKIEDP